MPRNPIGVLLRNRRAGEDALLWTDPECTVDSPAFALSSPSFVHGAAIPSRYRGHLRGGDVSPALSWTVPPTATRELVLVVQDRDVPFRKPATHALTAGIDPASSGLVEGAIAVGGPVAGLQQGRGPLGRRGWSGPMPIPSHGPHTYVFQLFALDRPAGLRAGFTLAEAREAMAGHVLARARLDGTYENA
ncbi:YbhB/YbcL family Raf kinase inhibitor-like protein [Curtobacterium pusillum]|uniref:YbhB/YbcL family Raf kinase inhibitor-like protein n=1 Tax=Curtobacterium pusillum TaxID=69373 RepID=UPI0011A3971A|nr:YbhB/YbcL family Raf kinase inhibitor-like protein [Curtobacterium pusillum]